MKKIILDNNLPQRMALAFQALLPDFTIVHIGDLGMADCTDGEIRIRLGAEFVIWITRDEDFWLDAPANWAIVWVACHNPRLAFLRESMAPAIARHVPLLQPSSRLFASEDVVTMI